MLLEFFALTLRLFEVGQFGQPFGRPEGDYSSHLSTYRGFIRGVALFAAHVLVILALLAYFLV